MPDTDDTDTGVDTGTQDTELVDTDTSETDAETDVDTDSEEDSDTDTRPDDGQTASELAAEDGGVSCQVAQGSGAAVIVALVLVAAYRRF